MNKYANYYDQAEARKKAAEQATLDATERKEAQKQKMLSDGAAWLENEVLSELTAAKAGLDGKILIEFHSEVRRTRLNGVDVCSVFFTVNPWYSSNYRSFQFEIRTDDTGTVSSWAHNPTNNSARIERFEGKIDTLTSNEFEKYLAKRIIDVVNLKT